MSTSKKTGSSSENTPPVKKVKSNKGKKEEEETPKQKLNTAESIMNRIKWDISIPKDQVIIGYLDRFVGIKQIDFVKFKGVDELEGVPLHRIRYFKLNGHIVWDRDNRIDLLTGKEVGHLVSANKITTDTLPSKSKKAKNVKYPFREQIPYYRYNDEIEQWEAITTSSHTRCSKIKNLKIINFNILFDLHETDRIFTPKRIPYILDILRDSNADIIALQEVRKSFLTQLVAQNWVQNNYFISDVTGDYTIGDHYGVVLLTRIEPNVLYLYRFSSMKTALIPVYIVIPGDGFSKENLVVPVVHLTSDLSTGPSNKRVKQLELLFNECERLEADHSIISGDFNFTDGEPEDAIINSWGKDVWLATHDIKKHPGYTYDPTNNHCAAITTHKNLQRRLDKIVVRSEKFMPQKVAILGQKAFSFVDDVSQNQIDLHPSDHYALQCELVTVQPESGFSDMKRSHSSALVIVPPRSAWKSIQKIRLASDKSAKRWPPHTKLMYPFFADEELDAVRLPLDKALTSIEPFIVKLTDFHSTEDGTIYLRATTSNADGYELHKLQDLVHKALPGCGENISEFNRLVVGQFNPDEVESKLTELRESWTPVEFLVDQVYVLSRDSNEPFSVQYSFPLGSNPVLTAQDIPSLSDYYTKNSLLESRESQQLKRQTLDYLESLILTHFSDNEATSGLSSKDYLLKTFGSYRLGIKSGDIDVVCICTSQNPPHTAKEFLEMMKYILCEDSKVASCYAAVDALIPTLSIAFSNGVDVDLLYTNIPTTVQETEQELQKMSKTDLLAVSGIREATYLLRYVPNRKYFQALISFVKHWAKRRGLYSNALCYLGGISWAILCAYICKHHPPMDHTRPILELIKTFFDVLAKWRWQQGIALNNGTTVSQSKFKDHLPIKLTTYPYDNSTRNVTASSQQVIIRELKRASEILSRLNATNTEEILDELSSDVTTEFTSSFKAFIKFEFSSTDQESYQRWCGWVRSRFVHFAVNIEKRKFTVQIFPTIIPSSEDPVCAGELYIGVEGNISDKHEAIIQEELKKFISVVTSWVPKTENMQISATIQHQVNFNL